MIVHLEILDQLPYLVKRKLEQLDELVHQVRLEVEVLLLVGIRVLNASLLNLFIKYRSQVVNVVKDVELEVGENGSLEQKIKVVLDVEVEFLNS